MQIWLVIPVTGVSIVCAWLLSPVVPSFWISRRLSSSLLYRSLSSSSSLRFSSLAQTFPTSSSSSPASSPLLHLPTLTPLFFHSTSTRCGWAGPLKGQHTLSRLSKTFIHQRWRHKPHTHRVVALGRKYLLNFCRHQTLSESSDLLICHQQILQADL